MVRSARRSSQDAKRCVRRAKRCESESDTTSAATPPKPLRVADLGEDVPRDATASESALCRARTYDPLIKSQPATPEIPEGYADSHKRAAVGAAVGQENGVIDPDLQSIIERWPDLPDPIRAAIVALVQSVAE